MRMRADRALLCLAVAGLCGTSPGAIALAQTADREPYYKASANDLGGVGLLQTRTARFHEDGTLDVGASFVDPYRRYYVTFQILPFLEGTFRYTDVRNRLFSDIPEFSGDQSFKDRGADLKLLLWPESKYVPQIAVGVQDGLGTGQFSGEYVVMSKRWYDFDFSFGMGWGLLGAGGTISNPLTSVSDEFSVRGGRGGQGGELIFDNFFSGETVGLFGGVEWHTPVRGLTLKLEYDGNDYQSEPLGNVFEQSTRFNFGLNYRPFEWLEMAAAYERGNEFMFRASLRSNVKALGLPKLDDPPPTLKVREKPVPGAPVEAEPADARPTKDTPPTPDPATPPRDIEETDAHVVAARDLYDGLEAAGLEAEAVELSDNEARIYLAGVNEGDTQAHAAGVAQSVVAAVPGAVERVVLVQTGANGNDRHITIERREVEQAAIVDYLFDGLEAEGYEVESLDISHRQVQVVVSGSPGTSGGGDQRVAQVLLEALPTPVERFEIVHVDGSAEVGRVVVAREDLKRDAQVDALFDGLSAQGFELESFEFSDSQATVYLSDERNRSREDYVAAARLVAEAAPEPFEEVVLVGLKAGVEATRVTLRRQTLADGLSAGQDAVQPPMVEELVPDLSEDEKRAVAGEVFEELGEQGFGVDAFELTRYKATIFVTPGKFRQFARNTGRAARAVANHVPDSVEEIEVVTLNAGLEIARVTLFRHDLEAAVARTGSPEEVWANAKIEGPVAALRPEGSIPEDAIRNPKRYPTLTWNVRPALRQQIGGPDGFYIYQIWLAATAEAELYRGLRVTGTIGKNITNNFDKLTLESDSVLPRVRSDIVKYLQQGDDGNIVRLQADYLFLPFPDWSARVSAGLLEEMFAGVGAEVLYRPFGSRLAIGADINRVRQRDFDQRFEFRDYKVTTGHLNVYYKLPWFGLTGEVHAGQFLAGDRGAQFVVSRSFASGMRLGGWATFTDVSAEDFGEGSFDKGFFISIPFELLLTNSTRRRGTFAFRPLTRDGGQMLSISNRLYGLMEEGNLDNIAQDWSRLLD